MVDIAFKATMIKVYMNCAVRDQNLPLATTPS